MRLVTLETIKSPSEKIPDWIVFALSLLPRKEKRLTGQLRSINQSSTQKEPTISDQGTNVLMYMGPRSKREGRKTCCLCQEEVAYLFLAVFVLYHQVTANLWQTLAGFSRQEMLKSALPLHGSAS